MVKGSGRPTWRVRAGRRVLQTRVSLAATAEVSNGAGVAAARERGAIRARIASSRYPVNPGEGACTLHSRPDVTHVTLDGNQAVASVAYRLNEVVAIYPITPASPMGEAADEWASRGRRNIFGSVPTVYEMQSEGGAAGAVHGALQAGALATTFTASQGLLLMVPNLYKIAGELTPFVLHVAARSVATHALSIFCDHSDVMACRQTGFAMLAARSVQQAQDFACIAQAATLRSHVPFLHFMDGFRTSHEIAKIEELTDEHLRLLIDADLVTAHHQRALSPDRPVVRGTAQNPDVFFQAREASNAFYSACHDVVEDTFECFARVTGRKYSAFEYFGHPSAERVVVLMGSATDTAVETVRVLVDRGERVGVVQVALYRPFDVHRFVRALPATTERIAVLDRTKEPGGVGEPLYLDVVAALSEAWPGASIPRVRGGIYGLSSKEFTPAMVGAVLASLADDSLPQHFTVGINDDVTHRSLAVKEPLDIVGDDTYQAMFFGLGSDGTVGANKNTIKIIGEVTHNHTQGYFVYDSKKAGAVTVSHLRFGPRPIAAPYLIEAADFVGCHQFDFITRRDVLGHVKRGGAFLLNSPHSKEDVWQRLPRDVQARIRNEELRFFVLDAYRVATEAGLGRRINTVMQAAFFAISGVLPAATAVAKIKESIERTYEKKGLDIVRRNLAAVDAALELLHRVEVPAADADAGPALMPVVPTSAPDFVQRVTATMLSGKGDQLPVSAFPVDGTWPVGTSRWEKRNLASEIPVWDTQVCIQCNKCVLACPHAAIRAKVYDQVHTDRASPGFKWTSYKSAPFKGKAYTIQVAPEDCTGCHLCVEICPAKDKGNPRHKALEMQPQRELLDAERVHYEFFLGLPEPARSEVKLDVKGSQLLRPLMEYSGACPGCGETPYLKLLTQLFGDRALIANATGCSSIYGGNLPTTPYTTDDHGRGPAWSNSLFEDNAEFGFGMRLAIDALAERARRLVGDWASVLGDELVEGLLQAPQADALGVEAQRKRVETARSKLRTCNDAGAELLASLLEHLVRRSVWLVGGDGWAYDIGYGGLDHVLASDRDVNILVLDTEVYSNTGGQQSKATPLGAAAKFAMAGKGVPKKDLGMLAMSYGHVYVARVAFGAKDAQTVRAFVEAEAHPGPSLIIAYSPCIAHGYDLRHGATQQQLAVQSGAWPLFRFDPHRATRGEPPLMLDSTHPTKRLREYMQNEMRFRMIEKRDPKRYQELIEAAERYASQHTSIYEQLARVIVPPGVDAACVGETSRDSDGER